MADGPLIVAFLGHQALGDFVMAHLAAAAVARALPESRLVIVYRDDRPYKGFVTLMNPWVTSAMTVPADPAVVTPLDRFVTGDLRADVLLTPSMLEIGRCEPPMPALRLPARATPALEQMLRLRGLHPDSTFVALHIRERGYHWRRDLDDARNADPTTYLPMIHELTRAGFQVVRLGDPSMRSLPRIDGLVDLTGATFPEQVCAIARARFFVGTDSGPTQVAGALKVPTATTNAAGIGVWNDDDVVLFKRFRLANGRRLSLAECLDASNSGMQIVYPHDNVSVEHNTPEDLIAVAEHMIAITSDCHGWRVGTDSAQISARKDRTLRLPLPWRPATETARLRIWDTDA